MRRRYPFKDTLIPENSALIPSSMDEELIAPLLSKLTKPTGVEIKSYIMDDVVKNKESITNLIQDALEKMDIKKFPKVDSGYSLHEIINCSH